MNQLQLPVQCERLRERPRQLERADGGDVSLYLRDSEDDVVELWDFFVDAAGAHNGVAALRGTHEG